MTFLFVVAVALLPRHQLWPAIVNAGLLAVVIVAAQLPASTVLARLTVIIPFVAFALFIPFVGQGPSTEVAGLSLSTEGLWAAWAILTKSTLGAGASIVLSSTTSINSLLRGLSVLRIPAAIVAIVAFMFRYLDLIMDQIHRMRNAMIARAYDPRWLWQAKPIASSAGALFVRTYEQGERTHLAMMSRGYTGAMPDLAAQQEQPSRSQALEAAVAAVPVASSWLTLLLASTTRSLG